MGILIHKQRGVPGLTKIARLSIIMLIIAISAAFIDTIWAIYMDSFIDNMSIIGFISAGLTLISFFSFFIIIPLIEKSNKSKLYSITLLMYVITYILFAINSKFYLFIVLAFILTILTTVRITTFGLIVKDKSSKSELSRNEGLVYTFMNAGWVVGPLIAGLIADKFGINRVFILAAVFMFMAWVLFRISKIKDSHRKKKADLNLVKNFIEFFKDKQRVLAYIIAGGGNFWWILIYLFMPLYILKQGLGDLWIGYFLFAVAVPLVLTEYGISKLAGKVGFKKMFKIGFFILAAVAIACFFINNIYAIMILLVLASIGPAILEPNTEAFFFDITPDKDESRFYGPFNTSIDVNQFVAKVVSSVALLFLPFKYIFLVFGAGMIVLFFLSCGIKDFVEKKRR
ncbi:MAG: MFS transporter [Nanoarchaeota archaeon]|nr:MFS transporter [Nanoarchaeota archaeon]